MDQFRPTDERFAKIAPHLPTDTRGKARAGRAVIAARKGGTDAAEAVGRAVGRAPFLRAVAEVEDLARPGATDARANAGLNKGEARNALARAVFFHRLGELRDRSFENQAYRASGLNLLVAAIILWNTRYLAVAFDALRTRGDAVPPDLVRRVAPLGWEHVGPTGDCVWAADDQPAAGALRPLRDRPSLLAAWFLVRSREPDAQRTFVS